MINSRQFSPGKDQGRIVRNQYQITLYGLKRAGNHGIMTWMASLYEDPVWLLNNSLPFTDPFETFNHDGVWDPGVPCFIVPEKGDSQAKLTNKSCLFISYEDIGLERITGREIIPNRIETIGDSHETFSVLILRDPFNLMASRIRKKTPTVSEFKLYSDALNGWKDYALEFVGKGSFLSDCIKISYNDWFIDMDYRKEIALQLGRPFSDKGLNVVTTAGRGSSFDDLAYNGKAQEMDVLQRWSSLKDDGEFCDLFRGRNDILQLSEQIFGEMAGTRDFLRSL